jgi:ABC-type antimicrobial peptide transport system permease subunit
MEQQRTFRFKITNNEFYQEIIQFSAYHKFENKETLKESYDKWCEEENIKHYFQQEVEVLSRSNYDFEKNSIHKKVFKSIKYYHIKNMLNAMRLEGEVKENKTEKPRVLSFTKEIIDKVKEFLNESYHNQDFKPSTYFEYFCAKNKEIIEEEKTKHKTLDDFEYRLKKMFKNQYFTNFKA